MSQKVAWKEKGTVKPNQWHSAIFLIFIFFRRKRRRGFFWKSPISLRRDNLSTRGSFRCLRSRGQDTTIISLGKKKIGIGQGNKGKKTRKTVDDGKRVDNVAHPKKSQGRWSVISHAGIFLAPFWAIIMMENNMWKVQVWNGRRHTASKLSDFFFFLSRILKESVQTIDNIYGIPKKKWECHRRCLTVLRSSFQSSFSTRAKKKKKREDRVCASVFTLYHNHWADKKKIRKREIREKKIPKMAIFVVVDYLEDKTSPGGHTCECALHPFCFVLFWRSDRQDAEQLSNTISLTPGLQVQFLCVSVFAFVNHVVNGSSSPFEVFFFFRRKFRNCSTISNYWWGDIDEQQPTRGCC